jgi:hypothetical protein
MPKIIEKSTPAITEAEAEARRLLALLTEEHPDADEIKDSWYALGLAVRAAVSELRQREDASPAGHRLSASQ